MGSTDVSSSAPDVIEERSVTLSAAQRAVNAAVAEAERIGVAVNVAVADRAGHLVAFARMPGAPLLSIQLAQDKAYSVAAFGGLPTEQWWSLIAEEPALVHGITKTPRLTIFGGGLPLTVGGGLVGAIGVSGGSAEQDVRVATAGAATLS